MMSVTEGRETVESLMSVNLPSVTDKGGPGELNVPPDLPPPKSVILREDLQRREPLSRFINCEGQRHKTGKDCVTVRI